VLDQSEDRFLTGAALIVEVSRELRGLSLRAN